MKTKSEKLDIDQVFKKIRPHMDKIFKDYNLGRIGIIESYLEREKMGAADLGFLIKFTGKEDNTNKLEKFLEKIFDLNVDLLLEDKLDENLKSKILKDVTYIEG